MTDKQTLSTPIPQHRLQPLLQAGDTLDAMILPIAAFKAVEQLVEVWEAKAGDTELRLAREDFTCLLRVLNARLEADFNAAKNDLGTAYEELSKRELWQ